jgi:hypothetical protein
MPVRGNAGLVKMVSMLGGVSGKVRGGHIC